MKKLWENVNKKRIINEKTLNLSEKHGIVLINIDCWFVEFIFSEQKKRNGIFLAYGKACSILKARRKDVTKGEKNNR